MAKENKINIELTEKQIDILIPFLESPLRYYDKNEIEIYNILKSAKSELSNTGAEYMICKQITFDFFRQITKGTAFPQGEVYPFTAIDGAHLKAIIKFLKSRFKKRNNGRSPEPYETGKSLSAFFKALTDIPDKWYVENFSLPMLNKRKAEIVSKVAKLLNKNADSAADRKRKNDEYWALVNRADKLIKKHIKGIVAQATAGEPMSRHDTMEYIFNKENLDWSKESDLRLMLLDRLENKNFNK